MSALKRTIINIIKRTRYNRYKNILYKKIYKDILSGRSPEDLEYITPQILNEIVSESTRPMTVSESKETRVPEGNITEKIEDNLVKREKKENNQNTKDNRRITEIHSYKYTYNNTTVSIPNIYTLASVIVLIIANNTANSNSKSNSNSTISISGIRNGVIEYSIGSISTLGYRIVSMCSDKSIRRVINKYNYIEYSGTEVYLSPVGIEIAQMIDRAYKYNIEIRRNEEDNYILLVDSREKKEKTDPFYFQSTLMRMGVKPERRTLLIADFIWVLNKESEYYSGILIERKTLNDLIHSLRDGRYKDQSKRLSLLSGIKIYLIEGTTSNTVINKSIYSSCISLVSNGFLIIRTMNMQESLCNIAYINDYIRYNKKNDSTLKNINTPIDRVLKNTQKKRIEEYNDRDRNIIYLQSIRGISLEIAESITDKLGSIRELIQKINGLEDISILSTIKVGSRPIGIKRSKRILYSLGIIDTI
ncbi:crossover junction endonuclease MUS81 [Nematocida sp. AWRm80]|nr:crossover junction endonuclease MUS81 [Nematocida sp. AWRm80]